MNPATSSSCGCSYGTPWRAAPCRASSGRPSRRRSRCCRRSASLLRPAPEGGDASTPTPTAAGSAAPSPPSSPPAFSPRLLRLPPLPRSRPPTPASLPPHPQRRPPASSAAHRPRLAVCNHWRHLPLTAMDNIARTLLPPAHAASITAYKGGGDRQANWRSHGSIRRLAHSTSSTSTSPPSAPRPSSPSSSACKLPRFPAPPTADLPGDPLLILRLFCVRGSLGFGVLYDAGTRSWRSSTRCRSSPTGATSSCIAKNQITKGKTDAFKSLRKHLLDELEEAFPDNVEAYTQIHATSAAESKRLAQSQSALPNGDAKVKPEH
ncbi:hypothetical protein ZWY2020_051826 [Hordeum vulgare]|nr:hypothetical protein ZWY2020_051826 [Hordeum vulgare]